MNHLQDICQRAVEKWGGEIQLTVVIEELGELITAIAKLKNKRKTNVLEELADVMIMIEQLKIIYNVSSKELGDMIQVKLNKLDSKLKQ